MNSFNGIGRLVSDPEVKTLPSGTTVCNMRVAIDRAGKKQDDGSYASGFFDVAAFGKLADVCAEYLSKGKKVGISGQLLFDEWESDAGKRSKVSIIANTCDFLTPASEGGSNGGGSSTAAAATSSAVDDDIPF